MTAASTWPGCHGVRLSGDALDLGTSSGTPLAKAAVRFGFVAPHDGRELWTQHGEVVVGGETIHVDRSLHRRASGTLVLSGNRGPSIEIDPATNMITVNDGALAVQRQLVATFALPLLLHETGTPVVHGSACACDGQTIVVCGDSGTGKSTLLVALMNAGWLPVSEDLCAIDQGSAAPIVWPGPPWVRVAHRQTGPVGAAMQFDSLDKTGWDIAPTQPSTALPVRRLVLLSAPAGTTPEFQPLTTVDAIPALARHSVWLAEPAERGRRMFGAVAGLAGAIEVLAPAASALQDLVRYGSGAAQLSDLGGGSCPRFAGRGSQPHGRKRRRGQRPLPCSPNATRNERGSLLLRAGHRRARSATTNASRCRLVLWASRTRSPVGAHRADDCCAGAGEALTATMPRVARPG